jgi:CAAX prenyl protease-like protein
VGFGLVAVTRPLRFFAAAGAAAPAAAGTNPAAVYLAPLLALVVTSMITGAMSGKVDKYYALRVLAVAGTLWVYRREYATWYWRGSWEAAGLGAVVFLVWLALEPVTDGSPDALGAYLAGLSPTRAAIWLAFRVLGSVVLVPVAEELAFRGYLIRRLIAADFEQVPPGRFTWLSFLVSSALFGVLHGRWLAGTLAGMGFAAALYRRGRLADAVLAHATTNALLAAYVLATGSWFMWS